MSAGNKTLILDHDAILLKLERIACEICEKHTQSQSIVICGMNSRGFFIAGQLAAHIKNILPSLQIELVQVTAEGGMPAFSPQTNFTGKSVVVADDVINTGKTLMQVVNSIFNQQPASIETAFLAKREHRNYPVKADYFGISLATTLQEHVYFDNSVPHALQVYLN
jgi:pyrimidine operon attenuation protein / uracil phosphoribosyltransferase